MLDIVEYSDIHIIGRTVQGKQLTQAVFAIILVCQFQDRFARQLAQPNDCATDQFVIPLAIGNQPGMADTCQIIRGRQIDYDFRIRMILEIRRGNSVAHFAFHRFCNDLRLIFTPRHQDHITGFHHGSDPHRDNTRGHIVQ